MAKFALCFLALTFLEIIVAVLHDTSGVFNHEPNVKTKIVNTFV